MLIGRNLEVLVLVSSGLQESSEILQFLSGDVAGIGWHIVSSVDDSDRDLIFRQAVGNFS